MEKTSKQPDLAKTGRFLAIETSSPRLSLAVGTEDRVLKEYHGPLEWRHADNLFKGMRQLLAQVGWPVQSLTGVVVCVGPGSFTGIRIGLAAARALGQSLKIPVVGVSSLQAIAFGFLKEGHRVCPCIDALRGEVFTGLYEMDSQGGLKTILRDCRFSWEDLAARLSATGLSDIWLTGEYPRASALLALGRQKLRSAGPDSYREVLPLYLRPPAAVVRLGK